MEERPGQSKREESDGRGPVLIAPKRSWYDEEPKREVEEDGREESGNEGVFTAPKEKTPRTSRNPRSVKSEKKPGFFRQIQTKTKESKDRPVQAESLPAADAGNSDDAMEEEDRALPAADAESGNSDEALEGNEREAEGSFDGEDSDEMIERDSSKKSLSPAKDPLSEDKDPEADVGEPTIGHCPVGITDLLDYGPPESLVKLPEVTSDAEKKASPKNRPNPARSRESRDYREYDEDDYQTPDFERRMGYANALKSRERKAPSGGSRYLVAPELPERADSSPKDAPGYENEPAEKKATPKNRIMAVEEKEEEEKGERQNPDERDDKESDHNPNKNPDPNPDSNGGGRENRSFDPTDNLCHGPCGKSTDDDDQPNRDVEKENLCGGPCSRPTTDRERKDPPGGGYGEFNSIVVDCDLFVMSDEEASDRRWREFNANKNAEDPWEGYWSQEEEEKEEENLGDEENDDDKYNDDDSDSDDREERDVNPERRKIEKGKYRSENHVKTEEEEEEEEAYAGV